PCPRRRRRQSSSSPRFASRRGNRNDRLGSQYFQAAFTRHAYRRSFHKLINSERLAMTLPNRENVRENVNHENRKAEPMKSQNAKREKKWKAGVLGATGIVGQRLVKMLADHPWFELTEVAASERSSGKPYAQAM